MNYINKQILFSSCIKIKTIKYKFSQSLSEEVKGKVTHKDFRIIRISPHPLQPPWMENFKDCISFNTLAIPLMQRLMCLRQNYNLIREFRFDRCEGCGGKIDHSIFSSAGLLRAYRSSEHLWFVSLKNFPSYSLVRIWTNPLEPLLSMHLRACKAFCVTPFDHAVVCNVYIQDYPEILPSPNHHYPLCSYVLCSKER